jgi:hypothetical protein
MIVPSQMSSDGRARPTIGREATSNGWGLVVFARAMMIILGVFHALAV